MTTPGLLFTSIVFLFFSSFANCQSSNHSPNNYRSACASPQIIWEKCFGGTNYEEGDGIIELPGHKGYASLITSESDNGDLDTNYGDFDISLVRLDEDGNFLWAKTYGGSGQDVANNLTLAHNGNLILACTTTSNDGDITGYHGNGDIWIIKIDSLGNILWQKCLGGEAYDRARDIEPTYDGGFIICGTTNSQEGDVSGNHGGDDVWVVKLDGEGNVDWTKCFGGSDLDWGSAIRETPDQGYMVLATTHSTDGDLADNNYSSAYWVIKLNSQGDIQWQKAYGGSGYIRARDMVLTSDGGAIITGETNSQGGEVANTDTSQNIHSWTIRIKNTGVLIWSKVFDQNNITGGYSICKGDTGLYVIGGNISSLSNSTTTDSTISSSDKYWALGIDGAGEISWDTSFGGSQLDLAIRIIHTSDNHYLLSGISNSSDGDVTGNHGMSDDWVLKIGCPSVETSIQDLQQNDVNLWPNPFQQEFQVDLSNFSGPVTILLFNATGKEVMAKKYVGGNIIRINSSGLSRGLYIVELKSKNRLFRRKIIAE